MEGHFRSARAKLKAKALDETFALYLSHASFQLRLEALENAVAIVYAWAPWCGHAHACGRRDLQEGLGVHSLNEKFKKTAGSLIKGFTSKSSVLGMFKLHKHPVARKV